MSCWKAKVLGAKQMDKQNAKTFPRYFIYLFFSVSNATRIYNII